MSSGKKYSIFIRIISGLLGLASVWAMIYNFLNTEEFVFEYRLISIAFVTCIFLFVAVVGTSPLKGLNGGK